MSAELTDRVAALEARVAALEGNKPPAEGLTRDDLRRMSPAQIAALDRDVVNAALKAG